ncbi:MAG: Yip1 family protein [bacterium]
MNMIIRLLRNVSLPRIVRNYFEQWWTIMLRPIYFFTLLDKEDWKGKPLTFLLITSWLLAALAATVVFILQFVPIGKTLVVGITGWSFVIILPVLVTLGATFYLITLFIVAGLFVCVFFALLFALSYVLHYCSKMLGGEGDLVNIVQNVFYCSAVLLVTGLIFILMVLTKNFGLDFSLFRAGANFIEFLIVIYVYGLLAVAVRKNYGLTKAKAFAVAIVPVLALLIFVVLFDKIALSKLQSWIT